MHSGLIPQSIPSTSTKSSSSRNSSTPVTALTTARTTFRTSSRLQRSPGGFKFFAAKSTVQRRRSLTVHGENHRGFGKDAIPQLRRIASHLHEPSNSLTGVSRHTLPRRADATFMNEFRNRWNARIVRHAPGSSPAANLLLIRSMADRGVRRTQSSSFGMEIPNASSHPITSSTLSRPMHRT